MNSKMIAIIAVVAMCGAALVGVGYAYQATMANDGNSVTTDTVYVSFTNTSVADVVLTDTNFKPYYNSVNNGSGVVTYDFNTTDNTIGEGNWIANSEDAGSITKYTKTVVTDVVLTIDVTEADSSSSFSIVASDGVSNNYIKTEYKVKNDDSTYSALNTKTFTKADGTGESTKIVTITVGVFVSVEAPAKISTTEELEAFTDVTVSSFTTEYKVVSA